ncbi:hypothetical protein K1719_002501 [Acacia pycnantha]|nr:hypothetical protein K1719_002501 [Acacia pycnantha]
MQEVLFSVKPVNILKTTLMTLHEYFFYYNLQVLEYSTPQELLLDEGSAFNKMVQSTRSTNAQYLRGLAFGTNHENSCEQKQGALDFFFYCFPFTSK